MPAEILDFTNVKESSGINPKRQPPGDYLGKIVKVDQKPANSGNKMWTFIVQDKNMVSATYPYRCTLNVEALWKVRNLLVAAGITVPRKKMKIDPEKLVGKEIGISLDDEEYEGKTRSVIVGVFPASELEQDEDEVAEDEDVEEDEDDEEEEPAPKKAAAKKAPAKKAPAKKPAEEEDEEDEDLDELDIDEL